MFSITINLTYRDSYFFNELDIEVQESLIPINSINMKLYLGDVLSYIKDNNLPYIEKSSTKKLGPFDDANIVVLNYETEKRSLIIKYLNILSSLYEWRLKTHKLSSKKDVDEYFISGRRINDTVIEFLKILNNGTRKKKSIIEKIKYIVGE